LVNGGDGLCNAVYVDDVVEALLLAGVRNEAAGEAFLISGEEPVTWREFYGAYERMLGIQGTVSMSRKEIIAYAKQKKKDDSTFHQILRALRDKPSIRARLLRLPAIGKPYRLMRSLTPECVWRAVKVRVSGDGDGSISLGVSSEKPIHIPAKSLIALFSSRTRVRIDKAKQRLGYRPRYDFERGMRLTAEWANWANLL
jgi:nucleoside-diphosphate-sugar epimerase